MSLGPKVQYKPLHKPFPLGPFPNDAATRFDPNSPTLQRLNFSEEDHTEEGSELDYILINSMVLHCLLRLALVLRDN